MHNFLLSFLGYRSERYRDNDPESSQSGNEAEDEVTENIQANTTNNTLL